MVEQVQQQQQQRPVFEQASAKARGTNCTSWVPARASKQNWDNTACQVAE